MHVQVLCNFGVLCGNSLATILVNVDWLKGLHEQERKQLWHLSKEKKKVWKGMTQRGFCSLCTLWLLPSPWQGLRWKPYKEDTTLPIVPNIFDTTPTWQYNSTICWCRCVKPCVEPMNYRCATPLAMSLKSTRVTTWIWLLCSLPELPDLWKPAALVDTVKFSLRQWK